jgi:hypothetical protein
VFLVLVPTYPGSFIFNNTIKHTKVLVLHRNALYLISGQFSFSIQSRLFPRSSRIPGVHFAAGASSQASTVWNIVVFLDFVVSFCKGVCTVPVGEKIRHDTQRNQTKLFVINISVTFAQLIDKFWLFL